MPSMKGREFVVQKCVGLCWENPVRAFVILRYTLDIGPLARWESSRLAAATCKQSPKVLLPFGWHFRQKFGCSKVLGVVELRVREEEVLTTSLRCPTITSSEVLFNDFHPENSQIARTCDLTSLHGLWYFIIMCFKPDDNTGGEEEPLPRPYPSSSHMSSTTGLKDSQIETVCRYKVPESRVSFNSSQLLPSE
jgi:hypothetical protein